MSVAGAVRGVEVRMAKCGMWMWMWEVETRAAVSEESERRRGYVLDFLDLDCCGTSRDGTLTHSRKSI